MSTHRLSSNTAADDLRAAFTAGWRSGSARLEDFVAAAPMGDRASTLRVLLALEVELRIAAGQTPEAAEYHARFPRDIPLVDDVFRQSCETQAFSLPSVSTATELHVPARQTAVTFPARIGPFEVLDLLGRGSFGAVLRARDTRLARDVALKVPRPGVFDDDAEAAFFFREARAAAQLHHPHIVPIHECGAADGLLYIVSEFIPGRTLRSAIDEQKSWSLPVAARMVAQLARALDYAHQKGVVHRDIKPENIMLTPDGEPHIMDFGLARREEGEALRTQEGTRMGTPAYMSPEQARGESHLADGRADQWSLGVLLYELVAGQRPWTGSGAELLQAILTEDPRPPSALSRGVPRDLDTIALKCLAKEPERRYVSCLALAEDLERWLRGEPIVARPVGAVERLARWCRRNPAIAALWSVIAIALLTGTGISSFFALDARQQAENFRLESVRANRESDLAKAERRIAQQERKTADGQRAIAVAAQSAQRRELYIACLGLAQEAIDLGNYATAITYLEMCLPREGEEDLRHFEWHQMWEQCHRPALDMTNHLSTGRVSDIAFSPDGALLAANASAGIKIIRTRDGTLVGELRVHTQDVQGLEFLGNERLLSCAGYRGATGEVFVWDVPALRLDRKLAENLEGAALALDAAPGGKLAAIAIAPLGEAYQGARDRFFRVLDKPGGRVALLDVATGELQRDLPHPQAGVVSVAFNVRGDQVVTGDALGVIRQWECATGTLLNEWRAGPGYVWSLAFSPDGEMLASASGNYGDPGNVKLWEYTSASEVRTLRGHEACVFDLAFSPDGNLLATGSWDNTAALWNVMRAAPSEIGQFAGKVGGHSSGVRAVAFSPDGATLATGTHWNPELRMWPVERVQHVYSRTYPFVLDPQGRFAVRGSADRKHLLRVDFVTGRHSVWPASSEFVGQLFPIADGDHYLEAGSGMRVRDQHGTIIAEQQQPSPHWQRVTGTNYLFNYRWADSEKTTPADITYWDALTLQRAKPPEWISHFGVSTYRGERASGNLAISRDHRLLAWGRVVDMERRFYIIDLETGEEAEWTGLAAKFNSAPVFSAQNRYLVSHNHYAPISIWDVAAKRQLGEVAVEAVAVAITPDEKLLITAGTKGIVQFWELPSLKLVRECRGHTDVIWGVTVSPDGRRVATTGWDATVRIWDTSDGRQVALLRTPFEMLWEVEFSRDGRTLRGSTGARECIWRVSPESDWTCLPGGPPVAHEPFAWPPQRDPLLAKHDAVQPGPLMAASRATPLPAGTLRIGDTREKLASFQLQFKNVHPPTAEKDLEIVFTLRNVRGQKIAPAIDTQTGDFGAVRVWLERPEDHAPFAPGLSSAWQASSKRYVLATANIMQRVWEPSSVITLTLKQPSDGWPAGAYRVTAEFFVRGLSEARQQAVYDYQQVEAVPLREARVLSSAAEVFDSLTPLRIVAPAKIKVGEKLTYRAVIANGLPQPIEFATEEARGTTHQFYLERLGGDPSIFPLDAAKQARNGNRYGAGGRIITPRRYERFGTETFESSLDTTGFPVGKYRIVSRWHVFDNPRAAKELSHEFELLPAEAMP